MNTIAYSTAHICRICECGTDQNDLRLDQNMGILNRLRVSANILIDINDKLPKFICQTCVINLDNAYRFRIQCELSDFKFRHIIEVGIAYANLSECQHAQQCHHRGLAASLASNNIAENNTQNVLGPMENSNELTSLGAETAVSVAPTSKDVVSDEKTTEDIQNSENTILNENILTHPNADCNDQIQIQKYQHHIENLDSNRSANLIITPPTSPDSMSNLCTSRTFNYIMASLLTEDPNMSSEGNSSNTAPKVASKNAVNLDCESQSTNEQGTSTEESASVNESNESPPGKRPCFRHNKRGKFTHKTLRPENRGRFRKGKGKWPRRHYENVPEVPSPPRLRSSAAHHLVGEQVEDGSHGKKRFSC